MAQSEVKNKYPIVFNKEYDITFSKLERLHVFDSQKWGKILKHIFGTYFKILNISLFCITI